MRVTKTNLFGLPLFVLLLVLFSACDSDEPDDGPGEEELITRVTITLSPSDGGADVIVEATDPDGDGADFQIGTLNLTANTTYTGSIIVFDDVNGEDITEEVEEEADEHQFFYVAGGDAASRVTVTVTDQDGNALPLGIEFTLAVSDGAAAAGTLRVVLSHYDDGPKDGVNMSDESDVDVVFPITITGS